MYIVLVPSIPQYTSSLKCNLCTPMDTRCVIAIATKFVLADRV